VIVAKLRTASGKIHARSRIPLLFIVLYIQGSILWNRCGRNLRIKTYLVKIEFGTVTFYLLCKLPQNNPRLLTIIIRQIYICCCVWILDPNVMTKSYPKSFRPKRSFVKSIPDLQNRTAGRDVCALRPVSNLNSPNGPLLFQSYTVKTGRWNRGRGVSSFLRLGPCLGADVDKRKKSFFSAFAKNKLLGLDATALITSDQLLLLLFLPLLLFVTCP
jgi:hypothetical protein